MKKLSLKISESGYGENCVSTHELYNSIKTKTKFKKWITNLQDSCFNGVKMQKTDDMWIEIRDFDKVFNYLVESEDNTVETIAFIKNENAIYIVDKNENDTRKCLDKIGILLLKKDTIKDKIDLCNNYLENLFEGFKKIEYEDCSERDLIELLQETYSFIYCVLNKISYEKFTVDLKLVNDEVFKWIGDYKFDNFKHEILGELGLEIKEEREDGIIVSEIHIDKNILWN